MQRLAKSKMAYGYFIVAAGFITEFLMVILLSPTKKTHIAQIVGIIVQMIGYYRLTDLKCQKTALKLLFACILAKIVSAFTESNSSLALICDTLFVELLAVEMILVIKYTPTKEPHKVIKCLIILFTGLHFLWIVLLTVYLVYHLNVFSFTYKYLFPIGVAFAAASRVGFLLFLVSLMRDTGPSGNKGIVRNH